MSNDIVVLFKCYLYALKNSNHRLERSTVHAVVNNITGALFRLKTLLNEINIIIKCDVAYY